MSVSGPPQDKIRHFRKQFQSILEMVLRWIFFWETDDKRLGRLIYILHQSSVMFTIVCYMVIHTLYPSYILLGIIWAITSIVWLLHIFTGGCVLTRIEQQLTGEKNTIIDPLLEIFHIPNTKETSMGITVLMSTVFMAALSFELFARTIINVKSITIPTNISDKVQSFFSNASDLVQAPLS
jgi:hypothetical protein